MWVILQLENVNKNITGSIAIYSVVKSSVISDPCNIFLAICKIFYFVKHC